MAIGRNFLWFSNWFRPPRHLLIVFLAITLVLAVALGWLSWRLLEQDRALARQRLQERLEHAADLVSAALLRRLSDIEEELNRLVVLPEPQLAVAAKQVGQQLADEEAVMIVLGPSSMESHPRHRLLYYPFVSASKEPLADTFALGEAFEFQQQNYAKAIAAFRELARSEDPVIRAGALLRLARNLRKADQPSAAMAAYDELAHLGSTPIEGLPAELLARYARCVLLDELNERSRLQQEARALYVNLHQAGWQLTRPAYRFYAEEARRWLSPDQKVGLPAEVREQDGFALTVGAEAMWEEWQRIRRGQGDAVGRTSLWIENRAVFLLWRSAPDRLVALVASSRYVERQWLAASSSLVERQGVHVALTDAEGHPVLGRLGGATTRQAVRTAADTQLPWTLHVVSGDPRLEVAQLAGRRRLRLAGLALMGLVVLVSSYFITRAVTRELEVARLQSDFVSAVSHEFRTPLTSICQLSELLADGRVSSERRREEYYEGIRRESQRLRHLVEGLLDFRRMEAGAQEYRFELCETATLIRQVVEEFAEEVRERGYRLEINVHPRLPRVRVDQEAFGRALRNLLDNAVKYSPRCQTIWVEADCEGHQVAIRVRDQGLGIRPSEQQQIFKKFVRGASAQAAGAEGTGLGLSMVHHIVVAHGGRIHVESQPDVGTTFTILLPAVEE